MRTIGCVVKDAQGHTLQRASIPTELGAWDYAALLLFREKEAKRVIFYDRQFIYINALSKSGYAPTEDEMLSEKDKQALILLHSL